MNEKEDLVKWKTVETITPNYPDGVIFIKEDTPVEFPLAMVAFPLGGHENGTKCWNGLIIMIRQFILLPPKRLMQLKQQ